MGKVLVEVFLVGFWWIGGTVTEVWCGRVGLCCRVDGFGVSGDF